MTTKKIPFNYDINRMLAVDLIAIIHIDDYDTRFLELTLFDDGTPFLVDGCTVTSRFVTISESYLLSDNVPCEATGNTITIPIDAAAVQMMACDIKIEVNIVDGEKNLTLPFPLWVRVRGSILDDAHITPESEGTIPELLEAVKEELERVQGYVDEEQVKDIIDSVLSGVTTNVPTLLIDNTVNQQYNPDGHLIWYYIDSDDIRHNIFDFSPYLETKDYNALQNRPVVTGRGRDVNTGVNTVLEGYINLSPDGFAVSTSQNPYKEIDVDLAASVPKCRTVSYPYERYDFNNITGTFARAGVFRIHYSMAKNKPETINDIDGPCFIIQLFSPANNANMIRYIVGLNANGQIVTYMQTAELERINAFNYEVSYQLDWKKIGEKGDTGATGADGYSPTATVTQTQNGAIVSITDKNGTTTANISNGVNGSDYILTAQDKSDIANIVLGLLPTTQGVQYGNQSN